MPFFVQVVIVLLVAGFLVWLAQQFAPVDQRFMKVAVGVLVLGIVIWVLTALFGPGGWHQAKLW